MTWFRNRSTSVKLMSGFALVGALLALIGWIGLHNMGAMNANTENIYDVQMLPCLNLAEMRGLMHQTRTELMGAFAVKDSADVNDRVNKVREIQKHIEKAWDDYEPTIRSEKVRAAFGKYKEAAQRYAAVREEKVLKPLLAGQRDVAWEGAKQALPEFE
jgi:methyl-accepting chemotaxis protein